MAQLVVKFLFQNEIRRISVDKEDFSFESAKKLATFLFPSLQTSPISFKYVDDESDSITVTSEKEFEEAVRVSKGILRLSIIVPNRSHPRGPVHPAYCDGCQQDTQEGIRGTRYKCTACPNYDLCESCFQKEKSNPGSVHSDDHVEQFFPIPFPSFNPWRIGGCPFQFRRRCARPCGFQINIEPVHRAVCDSCSANSPDDEELIRGNRYKCTSCPDYDLCQSCFSKEQEAPGSIHTKEHSQHFVQLSSPWQEVPQFPKNAQDEKKDEPKEPSTPISIPITSEEPQVEPTVEEPVGLEENSAVPEKIENTFNFEEVPQEKKPQIVSPFEAKLRHLEEMGFLDRENNIQLLVKYRGNLLEAVKELLQL